MTTRSRPLHSLPPIPPLPCADFPISAYRELQCHRRLVHPNIVSFSGSFADDGALVLVLERLQLDLADLVDTRLSLLPVPVIRTLARMLLGGVAHMHAVGIMHRDIKPSNLLFSRDGVLKIADFGIARPFERVDKRHREQQRGRGTGGPGSGTASASDGVAARDGAEYTNQVSSRWYRAPEVLFGARAYGPPVDLWAVGCIVGELYLGRPLAPAGSDIEQLSRVLALRGTPTAASWPGASSLPDFGKVHFTPCPAPDLVSLIPRLGPDAADLLDALLQLDPARRPTASQALAHPYFSGGGNGKAGGGGGGGVGVPVFATLQEVAEVVRVAAEAVEERRRLRRKGTGAPGRGEDHRLDEDLFASTAGGGGAEEGDGEDEDLSAFLSSGTRYGVFVLSPS
jgi:cyclin-dependent kinase 7